METISITNIMDKLEEVFDNEKYCEIRTLINDSILDLYKALGSSSKTEYSKKLSKLARKIMEVTNGK